MGQQLHKRLTKEFAEEVLEAFNETRLAEEKACEPLGINRARFYRLRRRWLRNTRKGQGPDYPTLPFSEIQYYIFKNTVFSVFTL